jgi:hypothetical protein
MSDSELIKNWEQGVRDFNCGRYWHAHEAWERGWLALAEPEKTYLQALIQVAGVFDLVKRGRPGAALRLARSALQKLQRDRELDTAATRFPRVEIQDVEQLLSKIVTFSETEIVSQLPTFSPQARLLLSPP